MPKLPNGQNVSDDQFSAYWSRVFAADPVMQQLRQTAQSSQTPGANPVFGWRDPNAEAAQQRAAELGFDTHDWSLSSSSSGGYQPTKADFYHRNKALVTGALLAPTAIGGISAALGAGGAAAAGGAGGSSAAVPAAGATLGPGVGFGAGGVPIASTPGFAGGTAATIAGGGASSVLPATTAGLGSAGFYGKALLGLGGDLLQGYFNNRGANKAADELNKSADKQIALYDKALGPYMDPGPLNIMKGLAGIPVAGAFNGGTTGGSPVPGQFDANRLDNATTGRTAPETAIPMGTAVPRGGTLAALAPRAMAQQQTQSSFIRMRAPDGEEGDVHPSQVPAALQAGARRIG